jgi:hypothetical protein
MSLNVNSNVSLVLIKHCSVCTMGSENTASQPRSLLWGKEFCVQRLEGWLCTRTGLDVAVEGRIPACAGN